MTEDPRNNRRHIRFKPDSGDYVQIDMGEDKSEFKGQEVALLIEESPMGGCSIACLKTIGLTVGQNYRFKVGGMSALRAEVVWSRDLDEKVTRYGLRFLE